MNYLLVVVVVDVTPATIVNHFDFLYLLRSTISLQVKLVCAIILGLFSFFFFFFSRMTQNYYICVKNLKSLSLATLNIADIFQLFFAALLR